MKDKLLSPALPLSPPPSAGGSLRSAAAGLWQYLGPAFIVSVAYMDPGNFGTNIAGGTHFGYQLLWVILWSNIMAIFVQILSAKVGIATGLDLPSHCRRTFSRPVNHLLWLLSVLAAIATDLAEFLGGVLGFSLLFHLPLAVSALLTGAVTYFICSLQSRGHRPLEGVITALVALISLAYLLEVTLAAPDWRQVAYHLAIPYLSADSTFIAAGMLGATVMPHVIFLHSQLVQARRQPDPAACRHHLFMAKLDVLCAMNMAFLVNLSMVIVAAAVFHTSGAAVDSIESAYLTLQPLLGAWAAGAFGLALLASGLSSAAVGTMAGELIIGGFIGLTLSPALRRLLTMLPGLLIIAAGINPLSALLGSQVVLSFALPGAVIPLMLISSRRAIMGDFVNSPLTKLAGWLIVSMILLLNVTLLYLAAKGC